MSDDTTEEAEAPATDDVREALQAELAELLGDRMVESHLRPNEDLWIRVDLAAWQDAFRALKGAGFTYFGFLSAIDWSDAPEGRYEDTEFDAGLAEEGDDEAAAPPADDGAGEGYARGGARFQLLAQLNSPTRHVGVLVKADLDDSFSVPTIRDIYGGADWHERELHEMFGVDVIGHPGLHPLYLPTEFEGHPLRKDFPLLARQVKPWPGVVDIEEIPEHLEAQLEAEVMAAFEAEGGGA